jgi:hypothetical protein
LELHVYMHAFILIHQSSYVFVPYKSDPSAHILDNNIQNFVVLSAVFLQVHLPVLV